MPSTRVNENCCTKHNNGTRDKNGKEAENKRVLLSPFMLLVLSPSPPSFFFLLALGRVALTKRNYVSGDLSRNSHQVSLLYLLLTGQITNIARKHLFSFVPSSPLFHSFSYPFSAMFCTNLSLVFYSRHWLSWKLWRKSRHCQQTGNSPCFKLKRLYFHNSRAGICWRYIDEFKHTFMLRHKYYRFIIVCTKIK